MKKLFALFVFALLIFSFASFGSVNAQDSTNDSDNSGSGSENSGSSDDENTSIKVEAEVELDSEDFDNDSEENNSDSDKDSEVEFEEETEIKEKDGETRIKYKREIQNADRVKIKEEFEIRSRTQLTDEQKARIIRARNRLRIDSDIPAGCVRAGSTLRCDINGTRTLTIHAGNSNNTIIQVKEFNASTRVTLYKDGEEFYGVFKDNETRKIILPDEVRERVKLKIKAKIDNETFNLDEEGKYEFRAEKEARLFALFKVREKIRAEIDAETGEVLETRNPWWGFLARDIGAESELKSDVNTGTFFEGEVPENSSDEENIAA